MDVQLTHIKKAERVDHLDRRRIANKWRRIANKWNRHIDFVGDWPTNVGDMPTTSLIEALFPQSRIAVLSALVDAGVEGLHLREIARRGGLNPKSVMRELHSLREAEILVSRDVGRQVIYRLNPHCPIYVELQQIIRKTVGLSDVLRSALKPLADRITRAYVYGKLGQR